jgi:hypothetical protein
VPLTPDPFDDQVVARVLELAAPATPWHRRLWQSGPMQLGAELLELAEVRAAGVVAKRDLQTDVTASLAGDTGLGLHAQAIRSSLPKDARDLTPLLHQRSDVVARHGSGSAKVPV